MLTKSINSLGLLVLTTIGVAASGCGDGPQCPSELVLVIQSPAEGASITAGADIDPNTVGVQTNVEIRSNFSSGAELTLSVTEETSGAVSQHTAMVDDEGDASFVGVTLPAGPITLTAEGTSKCGVATDTASFTVITDGACTLTVDEGPIDNDFYAPIPVLNSTNDSNLTLPNFQANVTVATSPGFSVEFFVLDVDANSEASVGTMTADGSGDAKFQTTLAQGRQVLRATCSLGSIAVASPASTMQVDTVVPTCALTAPASGVTVTPDDDEDSNDMNGIQMTWAATVDAAGGSDIVGEAANFTRDTTDFAGSALDANGNTSTPLGEFTAPGAYEMALTSQDHAGNLCTGSEFTANVIMDGCSIVIDEPSTVVSADSDGVAVNGLQSDFTVTVDVACAGESVFVDCGQGETSATAPANGVTTVSNVTLSTNPNSENSATCTARVVNSDNFQTSNQRVVSWDTLAPVGALDFVTPGGLTCGDTLLRDTATDADNNLANGFQIVARVIAPTADTRNITVANSVCSPTACSVVAPGAGGTVSLDLEPGSNDIRAVTADALGNQSTTAFCDIRLEDIDVDIVAPAGTGFLSASDGTINGSDLEVTICATSSLATVTMSLDVDATTTVPMTFNVGLGQFCTNTAVSLSEGNHQIIATADEIVGTRTGSDTVDLVVDITPPDAPTGLTADSPNRQDIDMSWSAVAGADSYVVKFSTTAFTDFPNEGTTVAGVGTQTNATINTLNAGTGYYVGVAASDAAGNLSAATTLGPIIPELDASGAIAPPDLVTASAFPRRYGQSIVTGNFNGDAFDDIAVSASFKTVGANNATGEVYIHFGSAAGISTTPDVTIVGPGPFTTFGYSMTRLNWSGTGSDGLAVSAPFGNSVFVFHGATLSAGTAALDTTDADISIVVDPTANWFSNSFLGWSLASGQLDSAVTFEELIIGAPSGGAVGGALVLYGGTPTGPTILISDTANGTDMAGLEGHIFQNPVPAANTKGLGNQVAYLGDMRAGNGVGDFGVGYSVDDTPNITQDNSIYVLRGRIPSGTAGITFTTLAANDLHVVNPTGDATNGFGMQMGSIADVSGDGFRDLVVTGHRDGNGQVWIVDGSDTVTTTLNTAADYLTRISGAAPASNLFGTGLANNAIETSPDINGDGIEDLVVTGGIDGATTFPGVFVWYGGSIPTGNVSADSAAYSIEGPASFTNINQDNQPNMLQAAWAGDLDGDGRSDIVWSDWRAGEAAETEGRMEILRDE